MAVATHEGIERIEELLGDEAESLLGHTCQTIDKDLLHLPGPDFVDRVVALNDRPNQVLRNLAVDVRARPPRRHRLPEHPAGRPGHRAQRGRELRAEPGVLRSREDRRARLRGRLQRGRVDDRRARRGLAPLGAQDPVHRQAEPQRAADVPERVRPDDVRERAPGLGDGRRRRRRDDLLRQRAEPPAARRGERGLRGGAPARDVHRALVLPAELGVQAGRRRLQPRRRPDRAGEPPRRHDRGRHHQAEAARGEQRLRRALDRRRRSTGRRARRSTRS